MNIALGIWFMLLGLIGLLRPSFFYRRAALSPERARRNDRIWRVCGAGLVLAGAADLVVWIVMKRG